MAVGYAALPAYRVPGPIDFSPLTEGFDALGKSWEKNRLLTEQKEIGDALRQAPAATSSAAPQYGPQPNRLLSPSPAEGAFAAAGRPSPAMDGYKRSIASIESGNQSDPYRTTGPVVQSGDRAYGKYQVMGANVGPWTKEILGREMSPEEFLASPEAQERVFEGKFGQYVQRTGNPDAAASMWFTGRPSAPNAQARDASGNPIGITGREYVSRFASGQGQPAPQPASATGPNFTRGADVAFRQGRVDTGLSLLEAGRERENQAYTRARQERADAQTSEVNALTIQEKRQELETVAHQKLASIAQAIEGQKDPALREAMWRKFVAVNPRIAATLQSYGIDPNDHAAGSQLLIAEARGLSPAKATVQEVQGRLVQQQPDGTFKEVYSAPPKPTQMMAADRKEVYESDESVRAGRQVLGTLDQALKLNQTAFTGLLPETRAWIGSQFGHKASEDTRELNNIVTRLALEQLKLTFGGQPTEGERQILLQVQGSLDESPTVRKGIFERAQSAVQNRINFNQEQSRAIRSGEYFQPGYNPNLTTTTQPKTQQSQPPRPSDMTDAQILEEARKQIAQGKDPAAVQARLEAWGVKF